MQPLVDALEVSGTCDSLRKLIVIILRDDHNTALAGLYKVLKSITCLQYLKTETPVETCEQSHVVQYLASSLAGLTGLEVDGALADRDGCVVSEPFLKTVISGMTKLQLLKLHIELGGDYVSHRALQSALECLTKFRSLEVPETVFRAGAGIKLLRV